MYICIYIYIYIHIYIYIYTFSHLELQEEVIQNAINKDIDELDGEAPKLPSGEEVYSGYRSWMYKQEKGIFAEDGETEEEEARRLNDKYAYTCVCTYTYIYIYIYVYT